MPDLPGIRLHLADEVLPLWRAVQVETGDPEAALPYWAFAWGGGLAIARYLREHPEVVAGRRVFDLASGSGLCAIAAMRAGATTATGADIDRFSGAAIELNARANRVRVSAIRADVLDDEPPDADVILAGDTWYEAGLAERVLPWLRRARDAGLDVLVGDPGRRYLPRDALVELASYDVRTTTELEDLELKRASVFALREAGVDVPLPCRASIDISINESRVSQSPGRPCSRLPQAGIEGTQVLADSTQAARQAGGSKVWAK